MTLGLSGLATIVVLGAGGVMVDSVGFASPFLAVGAATLILTVSHFFTVHDHTPSDVARYQGGPLCLSSVSLCRRQESQVMVGSGLSPILALLVTLLLLILLAVTFHPASGVDTRPGEAETGAAARLAHPPRPSLLAVLRSILSPEARECFFVLLSIFFGTCGFSSLQNGITSISVFKFGLTAGQSLIFLSIAGVALMVGAVPAGWMASTPKGRLRVVMGAFAALTVLAVVGFFVTNRIIYGAGLGLAGLFTAFVSVHIYPLVYDTMISGGGGGGAGSSTTSASDGPSGGGVEVGAYAGLYNLSLSLASVVGPLLAGLLVTATGRDYSSIFLFAGCCEFLALVFIAVGLRKRL